MWFDQACSARDMNTIYLCLINSQIANEHLELLPPIKDASNISLEVTLTSNQFQLHMQDHDVHLIGHVKSQYRDNEVVSKANNEFARVYAS